MARSALPRGRSTMFRACIALVLLTSTAVSTTAQAPSSGSDPHSPPLSNLPISSLPTPAQPPPNHLSAPHLTSPPVTVPPLLETGTVSEFEWLATASAGTRLPSHATSKWELRAKLLVSTLQDYSVLKLSDIRTLLSNGPEHSSAVPEESAVHHDSTPLLGSWQVRYRDGGRLVADVRLRNDEPTWSHNMKRALSSLLQLDAGAARAAASAVSAAASKQVPFIHIFVPGNGNGNGNNGNGNVDAPPVFEVTEATIHGNCKVKYVVSPETDNAANYTVRKFTDHESCDSWSQESWANMPTFQCPTNAPSPLISHSETQYVLSTHQLEAVKATGMLLMQPFQANAEMQYISVRQSLTLLRRTSGDEAAVITSAMSSSGSGKVEPPNLISSLAYQHPEHRPLQRATRETNSAKVMSLLEKMAVKLAQSHVIVEPDKLHDQTSIQTLDLLTDFDYSGLEKLYETVFVGTSYEQETMGNLLLELLPQVGTGDSVLFTINLIKDRRISDWAAIQMLMALPFYLRPHALFKRSPEEMLTACEPMIDLGDGISYDVKKTAVLTFASLVNKICSAGKCQSETVDKYTRKYVDRFTECTQYACQMLYLQGLSNLEMGQVVDFLEPVIRGNVSDLSGTSTHHIRFLAVWAAKNQPRLSPERVYRTYWPILANRTEHLEMRVAALTMLMSAPDSPARYFSLLWYLRSQSNNQLYHFFYTTVHSLAQTKFPCHSHISQIASQLVRLLPDPEDRTWPTGNYIIDYEHPSLGLGGLLQLTAIGSERTFQPTVLMASFHKHASQRVLADVAVYVKLQGVSAAVQSAWFRVDSVRLQVSQLAEILRNIGVKPRGPEPIHIELIIKRDGRTVLCYHLDHTTFNKLHSVVEMALNLLSQFHLNAQRLWYPMLLDVTQPTLLGTPANVQLTSSALASLRGDFTQEDDGRNVVRNNNLDARFSFLIDSSLRTLNPLSDTWHGADRALGFHAQLAFVSKIAFDIKYLGITIGPLNDTVGAVGHLRSGVLLTGNRGSQEAAEAALKKHCPLCTTYHAVGAEVNRPPQKTVLDVSARPLGAKLNVALFDCDRPYTSVDYIRLISGLIDQHTNNYQMLPGGLAVVGLAHLLDISLVQAPRGSCGLIATIKSIDSRNTELDIAAKAYMQLKDSTKSAAALPGDDRSLQASITHRVVGGEVLHQIDAQALLERKDGHELHNLRLKLIDSSDGPVNASQNPQMLCLDARWHSPPWHPDLIPLSDTISGGLNAVFGKAVGGRCPKEGEHGTGSVMTLNAEAKAEATMEQLALATTATSWPYNACKQDSTRQEEWGPSFTPFTPACQEEARQLATLRRYHLRLNYNSIPTGLVSLTERISGLLQFLQPLTEKSLDARSLFDAVLEFPVRDPLIKATINSRQFSFDYSSLGFAPLLYNARFPRPNTNLGLVSSCIVTTKRVISWDNATISHALGDCYTLAAAECAPSPKFALFIKKVQGPKPLGVRLYTGGNYLELLPDKTGKIAININGRPVTDAALGVSYPSQDSFYDFKVWERTGGLVEVESRTSSGWLQYYGHSALFMLGPGLYSGYTCGLCGDLNSNGANDIPAQLYSMRCDSTTTHLGQTSSFYSFPGE